MVRWLVIGIVALSALWGGYWFSGSAALEGGANTAVERARALGWQIDYSDLSVAGFPNRFDTEITEPEVSPPDGDWTWRAPFVQVFALSYRPNHVIVVAPPSQTVETGLGSIDLSSDDMRGSVVVEAGLALTLQRATVTATGVSADLENGRMQLREGVFAIQDNDEPRHYDLAATLDDITLPPEWLSLLRLEGKMPPTVEAVRFDGRALFTNDIDRTLRHVPGIEQLTIRDLSLHWGEVEAQVTGELAANPGERPDGALTLSVIDLSAAMALLEGMIPPDRLAFAGRFLAGFAPEDAPDGAKIDLSVRDGLVLLGPIPVLLLPPLSEG